MADKQVRLEGQQINVQGGRLGWIKTRTYWQRHPVLFPLVVVVTIGAPFLGLYFSGLAGVAVGLIVGIAALLVGLFAVTCVRETDRMQP